MDQTFEETDRKKQRKIAKIDDNGEELLAEKKNTEEKRRKWPTEPSTKGKLNAPKNHMIEVATEPSSMRVLKTADLGTQALLVVNSFKLHLIALIENFKSISRRMRVASLWPVYYIYG